MAEWNPNKTATLGLEWFPIVGGAVALDSAAKMTAVALDQTVSQIIGTIQIPNSGLPTRGGLFAVEVYDNETGVPVDSVASLDAVPNEDVTDGSWVNQASSNVNLFAGIDEGFPGSSADDVHVSGFQSTAYMRFNTGSLALTGKRILAVKLGIRSLIASTGVLTAGLNIGGVDYAGAGLSGLAGPRADRWDYATWLYNPATRKPWTIADVQAFDTTDEFFLRGQTQAGVWAATIVYAATLSVYFVTENRLAVGTLDDAGSALTNGSSAAPAWNTATMLTPTGGAWTKDGSGRHLYTVRRISSGGSMNVPFLDSQETVQSGSVVTPKYLSIARAWEVFPDPTYGHPAIMIGALSRIHPLVQRTTVPADSVDSLPYTRDIVATVYTGRNAESEFSGAAATDYGVLRFYLATLDAFGAGDLLIKVKRRSDNVQFGSTVTLTAAQFRAIPPRSSGSDVWGAGTWRLVQVQLSPTPATLAAATQYYIEFSSTTQAISYWALIVPDTNGAGQAAGFDGTSDAATYNALAENTSSDIAVTIATVPVAPGSMTAALGSQTVVETVNCVTAIPRADLSWTATSLGAAFLRYEIQRSEDAGTTWVDVAWVTVESVVAWKDYEAKRGVAASYRIRVVRTDGAFSVYRTAGATVTKPLLAGTGAYAATMFFVSNYNPTQNLAVEYQPAREFSFNEADEQQLQGAYGQDYQLGANPIENRGVTAKWTLLVGLDDKVASGSGVAAFAALRALARAQIPYVCALDHQANRLLVQLKVPDGSQDTAGTAERYLATAYGSEVAATPNVASVST